MYSFIWRFQNGQSLGGAYKVPTLDANVSSIALSFSSTTAATATFGISGKVETIQRFRF